MPIKNLQFEILQIISKYVHELRRMPTNYPVMTYGIYTAMLSYGAREHRKVGQQIWMRKGHSWVRVGAVIGFTCRLEAYINIYIKRLNTFFIARNCKFLFYFKKILKLASSKYDFPVYNCMLFGWRRDLFHFYIILLVNQKIS